MSGAERDEGERRLLEEASRVRGWSPAEKARAWSALSARAAGPPPRLMAAWAAAGAAVLGLAYLLIQGPGEGSPAPSPPEQEAAAPAALKGPVEASVGPRGSSSTAASPELPAPALDRPETRLVDRTGPPLERAPRRPVARTEARLVVPAMRPRATQPALPEAEPGSLGMHDTAPELPLLPSAPLSMPANPPIGTVHTPCDGEGGGSRTRCLEQTVERGGLAAENALYVLGLEREAEGEHGAALALWDGYRARFASGVLAPEVSRARLQSLLALHREGEALSEAELQLRLEPGGTQSDAVRLVRARLLRAVRKDPAAAAAIYAELTARRSAPEHRQEALLFLGLTRLEQGERAAARTAWQAYLSEFPASPHAAEVRAWLPRLTAP